MNPPIDPRMTDAIATVEASDFEQLVLWERHHNGPQSHLKWQEDNRGLIGDLGEISVVQGQPQEGREPGILLAVMAKKFPVCVVCNFAKLAGHQVVFWRASSRVVDHDIVRAWFEKYAPNAKIRTDAANFHNVIALITSR